MGPILLTGATGQVGGALLHALTPLGEVVAPTRQQLDLTDPDSIRACIHRLRPRWVVNPAAYTAVDKAESEPSLADAVNHLAVQAIGEAAHEVGAAVAHFSTDYVFSGTGTAPYRETDPTAPASVYGATKLAGEQALAASGAAHLIFRTSWVYGATGKNFLLTILKLARERDTVRIVADQHGAPTGSGDLARMTLAVMRQTETRAAERSQGIAECVTSVAGTYHAAGAGSTTWFGFAEEALRQLEAIHPNTRFAKLLPITSEEYPTLAKRPLNSRLDCTKLAIIFGWTMPPWQDTLAGVLAQI